MLRKDILGQLHESEGRWSIFTRFLLLEKAIFQEMPMFHEVLFPIQEYFPDFS